MAIWRLTYRQLWVRRVRTLLTVAAIAFAVSLVVAVTTGFESLSAVAVKMVDRYMGSTDVFITARNGFQKATFDQSVLEMVEADSRVRRAVGRFETEGLYIDHADQVSRRSTGLVGLSGNDDEGGGNLQLTAGEWFKRRDEKVAVINTSVARRLEASQSDEDAENQPALQVGENIRLAGPSGELVLKVVGVVHQPRLAGQTIYVPIDTLRDWILNRGDGAATQPKARSLSRVMIELKDGKDLIPFEKEWSDKLKPIDPNIRVKLARTNKEALEKNLMGLTILSALGVSISLVAGACIIFSTLSMGVAERQRQLAMLRAVGASRSQVSQMVVLEGVLLALGGVMVGVPMGFGFVWGLTWYYSELFSEGAVLSFLGVAYALSASLLVALAATLLPAWQAGRVSPLEAMGAMASTGQRRWGGSWPWRSALVGILCIMVTPLNYWGVTEGLVSVAGGSDALVRGVQFYIHFAVGLPLTMLGFFALSPMVVKLVETCLGHLAGRIVGVPISLLRQQLSGGDSGGVGGSWRASGTACALMVGLSVLIVMQVQGRSALGAWKLPDKFPDIFILYRGFGGLKPAEIEKLEQVEGLVKGDLMPIAIASPSFGNNFLAIMGAMSMPESTMFFGLNPEQANRMTELEFRVGDRNEATEKLKKGGYILITEEFRQIKGLTVGDKLALRTRKGMVDFEVAAVVWSPGMEVFVSLFDLGGQFEQRTAYSVFGTLEDAREYFGVTDISIFAANVNYGVERQEVNRRLRQEVGKMGLQAFDVRQIKAGIQRAMTNLLLMASSIAFAALAVASLGVANTVMASIRSRQWQFGILRAVGTTRGQLVRLVLAESLLLGVAASLLGLGCGAWMTMNARAMTRTFIGFVPQLTVPWGMIGIGLLVTLGVAVVASAYPAMTTARRPVLGLLQSGRGAG